MTAMIVDLSMYRRACQEVSRLEKLVKSGEATERDRQRYRDGMDHTLIWEWAHGDAAPAVQVIPSEDPLEGSERQRDPRAVWFADWFDRVKQPFEGTEVAILGDEMVYWFGAFWWWVQPFNLTDTEASILYSDASDEIHERRYWATHPRETKVIPLRRPAA